MMRTVIAALVGCALLADVSFAGKASVPGTGEASFVVNDKYVQEFKDAMDQAKKDIAATQAAVAAITIPPVGAAAAFAGAAAVVGEAAALGPIMAKAEAAHLKMLKHLMGADECDDRTFDLRLSAPAFDGKADSANVKPYDDPVFRDSLAPMRQAPAPRGAGAPESVVSAPLTPAETLSPAAPAPARPAFQLKSSQYSYGGGMLPSQTVGVGFSQHLQPSAPQAAYSRPAGGDPSSGGAGASAGPESSPSSVSLGATQKKPSAVTIGSASQGEDKPPPPNPAGSELSSNTSDQAQKAAERILQRQQEARQQAEKAKERAEQEKKEKEQRQQQMKMAALMAAGQAVGQIASAAIQASSQSQKKEQEYNTQGQQRQAQGQP